DVGSLEIGHSLHLADIKLPAGVKALTREDATLVTIVPPSGYAEEQKAAAAAAAGGAAPGAAAAPAAGAAAPAAGAAAPAAAGKVRVKTGGGIAGHNGLRSISAHIGNEYRRVRLGIGHPGVKELVHGHVLSDFAKSDNEWVATLCDAVAEHAALLAKGTDAT